MGGETALAAAAGAGQAKAVRWLLQRGADAGLCDDRHASPLDKARRSGHAACAQATPVTLSVPDVVVTCESCPPWPRTLVLSSFTLSRAQAGGVVLFFHGGCLVQVSNTECM